LEAFVMEPSRIAALRRGVAEMKKRKPSDPTSWFFQAAVHGVSDEAIAKAQEEDPAVTNVEKGKFWNQCPHQEREGTSGADFLIWHRAYLYYFERILRVPPGFNAFRIGTTRMKRNVSHAIRRTEFEEQTGGTQPALRCPARERCVRLLRVDRRRRSADQAAAFFGDGGGLPGIPMPAQESRRA
jgi:hypothetical protein